MKIPVISADERRAIASKAFNGMYPQLWELMKDRNVSNWRSEGCSASMADAEIFLEKITDEEIGLHISSVKKTQIISISDLSPLPRRMPVNFKESVKHLRRPYIPISEDLFETLAEGFSNFYEFNGVKHTFGKADGGYALMPWMD